MAPGATNAQGYWEILSFCDRGTSDEDKCPRRLVFYVVFRSLLSEQRVLFGGEVGFYSGVPIKSSRRANLGKFSTCITDMWVIS